jgi:hypothetical protein
MVAPKPPSGKKYFTVEQANATLPLVRSIVHDITALARDLRDRHERLSRIHPEKRGALSEAHQEEMLLAQEEFERGQERMEGLIDELRRLGIELKDYFIGLIDFPCWMNGREVYLCWRQGEADVSHWHEIDAGFAGRQKLQIAVGSK